VRTLQARAAGWTPDASVSRAVRDAPRGPEACAAAIARLEAGGARVVVRRSGTEPVVRVMVEHPDAARAEAGVAELVGILEGR
jgi:phosphomannomutase